MYFSHHNKTFNIVLPLRKELETTFYYEKSFLFDIFLHRICLQQISELLKVSLNTYSTTYPQISEQWSLRKTLLQSLYLRSRTSWEAKHQVFFRIVSSYSFKMREQTTPGNFQGVKNVTINSLLTYTSVITLHLLVKLSIVPTVWVLCIIWNNKIRKYIAKDDCWIES